MYVKKYRIFKNDLNPDDEGFDHWKDLGVVEFTGDASYSTRASAESVGERFGAGSYILWEEDGDRSYTAITTLDVVAKTVYEEAEGTV